MKELPSLSDIDNWLLDRGIKAEPFLDTESILGFIKYASESPIDFTDSPFEVISTSIGNDLIFTGSIKETCEINNNMIKLRLKDRLRIRDGYLDPEILTWGDINGIHPMKVYKSIKECLS